MLVTRISTLTGVRHTREIDLTEAQFKEVFDKDRDRYIQDIVPHLSADDREYLLSGTTPEEWAAAFPEE